MSRLIEAAKVTLAYLTDSGIDLNVKQEQDLEAVKLQLKEAIKGDENVN